MNICSLSVLTGNEGGNKKLYARRTRIRGTDSGYRRGPRTGVERFSFSFHRVNENEKNAWIDDFS